MCLGGITTNLMSEVWADIVRNGAETPCHGRQVSPFPDKMASSFWEAIGVGEAIGVFILH